MPVSHFAKKEMMAAMTEPPERWAALYLDEPSLSPAAEVQGAGYSRRAIRFSTPNEIDAYTATYNSEALVFAAAGADWGAVRYVALFDAQQGGNLLAWAALDAAVSVRAGTQLFFEEGELQILHI